MNSRGISAGLRAALLLAGLWCAAFALACRLTTEPSAPGSEADIILLKALTESRSALGTQLFEVADRTFHKGVGVYRARAITGGFARWGAAMAPHEHTHLQAAGVNEMAPWLYLATRADPHNVKAYIVAAFWLAGEGGRPDLAQRVLNEARANNPKDYRVYLEKGRLALKSGALDEAARMFAAAAKLWEHDPGQDETQARTDRAEMLIYRGLLHEEARDVPAALECYREALALFPGRLGIRERMAELTTTGRARVAPSAMWRTIMFQRRHECAYEQSQAQVNHGEH
ncbi:MAG: tetratricopeptide repeat protein [Lentisphaerae bacterium]|nr:tetratricopeptide repeat protein [Lentisphaerota bacterium]